MNKNIIAWLELNEWIDENINYLTTEEYENKVKELKELYEIIMNE